MCAISLAEAVSLIEADFPDKLAEFERMLQQCRALQSKSTAESSDAPPTVESAASADRIRCAARNEELERRRKQAMEAAAEFNRRLMLERRTTRTHMFDTQTWTLHGPRREATLRWEPISNSSDEARDKYFPVALLRGQYQAVPRRFSPAELRRLPFSSVLELAPSGGAIVRNSLLQSFAAAQRLERQLLMQQAEASDLRLPQASSRLVPDGTADATAATELDVAANSTDAQQRPACFLCGEPSLSPAGPPLIQCSLCERFGHPLPSCFGISEKVAQRALKYE